MVAATRWTASVVCGALFTCMLAAGPAVAQEEAGILEDGYDVGLYDDDDTGNDWFFDSYAELDDGILDDSQWQAAHEFFSGAYDDGVMENDWFYDTYEDPGDEGFWDV